MNAVDVRQTLIDAMEAAEPYDKASAGDAFQSGLEVEGDFAERAFLFLDTEPAAPAPPNSFPGAYVVGFDLAVFYWRDVDSMERRLRDYRTILVALWAPTIKRSRPHIWNVEIQSAGVLIVSDRSVAARWTVRVTYNPQE